MGSRCAAGVALALALAIVAPGHRAALAYELTDQLSIDAVGTVVFQYGDFDGTDVDDELEGSGVVDLALSYRPTPLDEFQAALSFAGGNALNDVARSVWRRTRTTSRTTLRTSTTATATTSSRPGTGTSSGWPPTPVSL